MTTSKYKALVTLIGFGGTLGEAKNLELTIGGNKKLDGPAYLSGMLLEAYKIVRPDLEIEDCRCSVLKINSHSCFFEYQCPTRLQITTKDGDLASLSDTVQVFVDRRTITEIPEEE